MKELLEQIKDLYKEKDKEEVVQEASEILNYALIKDILEIDTSLSTFVGENEVLTQEGHDKARELISDLNNKYNKIADEFNIFLKEEFPDKEGHEMPHNLALQALQIIISENNPEGPKIN